ncbi:6-phospho-beta-glucosidase [Halanaerobacter jeridensis]|uniref:6-phospho-beta-glucosidase n=1 Tax=Halanaerobacter jeridensis TaxID=706427 RepID=A0A939BNR2_9FIRM|nr:6-phospho-beta-glucosidase [Halanaerobacter jeridensis]MBM7555683.1 6-phospho-beta-glucosidase [Halanaerobacter jeridensis]
MEDKKALKITVIGGGSSYTPEIIEGLIERHHQLPVAELYLVDIEAGREKLNIVGALAQRMIEQAGLDIDIHLTLDREEAIKEADFIITQFRVGLLDARIQDEKIPLQYNCLGQETTGAGGMAKALRTIPVILDICADIERLAPEAWLINFTNPSGIITETVLKHTDVQCIGLCNVPVVMHNTCAEMLEVERKEIELDLIGLNHLVWGRDVIYKGQSQLDKILSRLLSGEQISVSNISDFPWEEDLLKSLELLPCPYHKYYYQTSKILEEEIEAAENEGTRGEVVKKLEKELFKLYQDPNLREKPAMLDERGGHFYSEAACDLINAIYNDLGTTHYLNVPNNGVIDSLPDDAVIERTCLVNQSGPHPFNSEKLEPKIRGLIQVVKDYEILTIQAGVNGYYDAAYQALLLHPLVDSNSVKPLLDDILAANSEYLPQFESVIEEKNL